MKTKLPGGLSFLKLHEISSNVEIREEVDDESSSRSINTDQMTSPHQFKELDVNEKI